MAGAIVQHVIGEGAGASTTLASGSFASNVTSGNRLLIITNSDTADTVTITKNSGTATIGTVSEIGSVTEAAALEEMTYLTCDITGTGSLDLLVTYGSSQANRQLLAFEISGSSGLQVSTIATDTGNNPSPNPALSVTVSSQPALGISLIIDVQGGSPTAGTGWTSYGLLGSAVHFIRVQTKTITATGSLTADFGNTGLDRANSVLLVYTDSPTGPTINTHPSNQTVQDGATAGFSVSATTSGGALSYQWQDNRSGSFANSSDGSGATSASYTTAALAVSASGRLYRCAVTDSNGTVNSNSATAIVSTVAPGRLGHFDKHLRLLAWF